MQRDWLDLINAETKQTTAHDLQNVPACELVAAYFVQESLHVCMQPVVTAKGDPIAGSQDSEIVI